MTRKVLYSSEDVLDDIIEHLAILLWDNNEQIDVTVRDPELACKRTNKLYSSIELGSNSENLGIERVKTSPSFLVLIIHFLGDFYHFL